MFTMPAACEFCSEACATVHCRADSARLCLTCDRHVHGANALSKRHPRTLLCHSCNVRPAVVRCSSCHSSFCETCDDNKHKFALGTDQHQRHSFQCFTGCPSATELAILWASQANEPRKRAGDMLTSSSSKEGVQYSLESRNGAVAPNPSARSGARGSWSVDTQRMDENSKIDANMSGSGPPPPLKVILLAYSRSIPMHLTCAVQRCGFIHETNFGLIFFDIRNWSPQSPLKSWDMGEKYSNN